MNLYKIIVLSLLLFFVDNLYASINTPRVSIIQNPKQRTSDREKYFSHEFEKIKIRRADFNISNNKNAIPDKLVGIGLSGGGVKSSAFQLGILAGLHKTKIREGYNLLNRVDYLSAVSGGAWAAGAYWSWPTHDDIFFSCLDEISSARDAVQPQCENLKSVLANEQINIENRNKWRSTIETNFLVNGDIDYSQIQTPAYDYLDKKPYLIINATHSNTFGEQKHPKNFPFEITMDQIGTIIDCNSGEGYCGIPRRLRWINLNNPPKKGFFINLSELSSDLKISMDGPVFSGEKPGYYLSHAMASSAGLIAKLISWHMNLTINDKPIPDVRTKYVLSDGGKSDNLGAISLLERGADLVILSSAAADAELKFNDLFITLAQSEKLLNKIIDVFHLIQPHFETTDFLKPKQKLDTSITHSFYKSEKNERKEIILIKPTQYNISSFMNYLHNQKDYASIYDYLIKYENDTTELARFPQNPTLQITYPKELIYSYYLLGEYIANQELAPYLQQWSL